jgi:hypothetical protein
MPPVFFIKYGEFVIKGEYKEKLARKYCGSYEVWVTVSRGDFTLSIGAKTTYVPLFSEEAIDFDVKSLDCFVVVNDGNTAHSHREIVAAAHRFLVNHAKCRCHLKNYAEGHKLLPCLYAKLPQQKKQRTE